jgi:DNA-binding transcriptional MocR family regulator
MAKKKDTALAAQEAKPGVIGELDPTYLTQQRDFFASGLASKIGAVGYMVWSAIKYHSNFQTGESWPGIRHLADLTGVSPTTVQKAIKALESEHLLRVTRKGKRNIYVARERMDVRVGARVICSIAVDYVPATMREKLAALKGATAGEIAHADVWAEVEIIPAPGFEHDVKSGTYKGKLRADEIPTVAELEQSQSVEEAKAKLQLQDAPPGVAESREKLRLQAAEMRAKAPRRALKK